MSAWVLFAIGVLFWTASVALRWRALVLTRRALTAELRAEAVPESDRARASERMQRRFHGLAKVPGVRSLFVSAHDEEWGSLYVVCDEVVGTMAVVDLISRAAPIGYGVHVLGSEQDVPAGAERISTRDLSPERDTSRRLDHAG
jgi:hypothetical protein